MKKLLFVIFMLYAGLAFASHNPRIEITPESWDFGKVKEAKILKYRFNVKNPGNDTLVIKHLATSSAWTTASIFPKKLYPGESAYLEARIDLRAIKTQERIKMEVHVESNDPEHRFKTISLFVDLDTKSSITNKSTGIKNKN